MKKNIAISIFNIFILMCIFLFMVYKHRYAIVCDDDMMQIIARTYAFFHSRFISEVVVTLIEKQIPEMLNLNYQDFAFISQGIVRSTFFVLLIHCISKAFFKLKEHSRIFYGIFYIISFFMFFSIILKYDFKFSFDNYPAFNYIIPILYFVLIWYKLAEFYILQKTPDKKDIIYLVFLVILSSCGNEYYNLVTAWLLLFIFAENLISKKDNNYIKIPLIVFLVCIALFYTFRGFADMYHAYDLTISFATASSHFKDFFLSLGKVLFIKNWALYVPIITFLTVLFVNRKQFDKNIRIIKYILISYAGFLLVLVGTIVFPANCPYSDDIKYWFMHRGLLTDYTVFLYSAALFLLGTLDIKKYLTLFLICCFIYIYYNYYNFNIIHSYKLARKSLYITDKLSVFYLQQGKPAIIPRQQMIYIFDYIYPERLCKMKEYNNKIFHKDKVLYLVYLEKNYGIDVSPGITFLDNDDAIKLYYKNGGTFTREEISKLKFSNIMKRKKLKKLYKNQ